MYTLLYLLNVDNINIVIIMDLLLELCCVVRRSIYEKSLTLKFMWGKKIVKNHIFYKEDLKVKSDSTTRGYL